MADIDVEARAFLERVDSLPVPDPPLDRLRAAGRRRTRHRQATQLAGVCVAIAGIVTGIALVVPGGHASRPSAHIPAGGPAPTSVELRDGRWVATPTAPIKTCFPIVVPDGTGVVVVEPGYHHDTDNCAPGAAAYDAATNAWRKISAPPSSIRADSLASWGGDRLIVIAGQTRVVSSWTAKTDRWSALPSIPAPTTTRGSAGVTSVAWTGSGFAAVDVNNGTVRVYTLNDSDGWTFNGELPAPTTGTPNSAAIAASNGITYVADQIRSGLNNHVELFERQAGHWTRTVASLGPPAGIGGYASSGLRPLGDGLFLVGDECPDGCMEDAQEAAFIPIHVGVVQPPVALNLKTNLFVAVAVAAGGDSAVAIYPRGEANGPGNGQRPATRIYSATPNTWVNGPRPPAIGSDIGAYWTSQGVLYLGHATEDGTNGFTRTVGFLLTPRR